MAHSLAFVVWEDAWSNTSNNWTAKEVVKQSPCILRSVGFLLQDDETGVSLALEYEESVGSYRKVQHIPRQSIQKVIYLVCEEKEGED